MAQPARSYRSPRRALQAAETRAAVLAAARASFAERGWAATSIRDVAAAAGVSVETVYGSVGAKAALFAAVYDGAVVGDDDPTPLAERPMFTTMGEGATVAERAAAAAELITGIHVRTVGLERALREGAASDAAMAELLAGGEAGRRIDDERGIMLVLRRQPAKEEIDLFWAMTSPETYDALVTRSGWTPERYSAQVMQWILELGEAR
jgi:AcrR family transcriptional regulator